MSDIIYNYVPLWGNWDVDELIGKGSIGNVYRISKTVLDKKYISAVKFISVPTSDQYNNLVNLNTHVEESQIENYFKTIINTITQEIDLLYKLKGHSNIITYEDHMVKKVEDENIWHIFIRMEHAKSLVDYIKENKLSESDIIKIGIDICDALIACHENNILHRDIKEANIFKSDLGNYKLGDFSVSRHIENVTHALTRVGTLYYMAPEAINGQPYKKNADIYSLGIVLYKLLNKGRLPFMPSHLEKFTPMDLENSQLDRMLGNRFNDPFSGSNKLINIVLKACSFNPAERYQTSSEMKDDLLSLNSNKNSTDTEKSFIPKLGNKKSKKLILFAFSILLLFGLTTATIKYIAPVRQFARSSFIKITGRDSIPYINELPKEENLPSENSLYSPKSSKDPKPSSKPSQPIQFTNILKNSGAEYPDTYWLSKNDPASKGTTSFTSETRYEGTYCLKLEKTNPEGGHFLYQPIDLIPGKRYVLSAFVKTKNFSSSAHVSKGAHLAISCNSKTWSTQGKNIIDAPNWKYVEHLFQVPPSFTSADALIYVNLRFLSGTVYFDNIRLLEAP